MSEEYSFPSYDEEINKNIKKFGGKRMGKTLPLYGT